MEIDREAEALGRAAIRWVGARNKEEFLGAIDVIAESAPATRDQALLAYTGVLALGWRTVHGGGVPNEEQNQALAERILDRLPWEIVELHDLYDLLETVSLPGRQLENPSYRTILAVFLTAGYIIAWYHSGLGYDDPYAFLDDLLNTLVTAPER